MRKKYLVISGGTIIDGSGQQPVEDSTVIIKDGKIKKIGKIKNIKMPSGEECLFIDAEGKTIIPGLIDAHTHIQLTSGDTEFDILKKSVPFKGIEAGQNAKKTLKAGFTTIRDLGAENLVDLAARDAVNQGIIEGPEILASGYKVIPTGADFRVYPPEVSIKGRHTMDSADEIRKGVRKLVAYGVDLIKIMTSGRTFRKKSSPDARTFSLEEVKTAVSEAHALDKPVSAHAHGAKGVKLALKAGCDTIEHGTVLDDEDIELMIEKNIYLIPTFSYGKRVEELRENSGLPSYIIEKALRSREKRLASFLRALKQGVKIAMGSDAGMPFVNHGKNAFELQEMVNAGMSPMQAIVSATKTAAEALAVEDKVGTIKEGKSADILVIDGDPLADISILYDKDKISKIIKKGKVIK